MLGTIPLCCCCRDGHRSRRFLGAPKDGASGVVAGTAACRLGGTGHGSGATPPTPPERRWRAKRGQLASQPRRERTTQRSGVVRASGNEVFALRDKTGTIQCLVGMTGTQLHCAVQTTALKNR